jgi:urease accessory protein
LDLRSVQGEDLLRADADASASAPRESHGLMTPAASAATAPPAEGWRAELTIHLNADPARARVVHAHSGPLRLQKILMPEGLHWPQAVLVHPPGGLCAGDTLILQGELAADAALRASVSASTPAAGLLVTQPGATKWYRSDAVHQPGRRAQQRVHWRVGAGCALEWLPHESIAFDAALADSELIIDLQGDARCIGWDVWVLGRRLHGDTFARGQVRQHLRITRDGQPIYLEHSRLDAQALACRAGLNGQAVSALAWCAGFTPDEAQMEALRAAHPLLALTCPQPDLLLARALAPEPEALMQALRALWRDLRPPALQRPATPPRLWAT